ncbi:MAG: VOC family protein [Caldilineaceae bacterium]|nr:VOC family protein [Caldilineaceae bacterium]
MDIPNAFELDHLFVCCEAGAPEAALLRDIGLTEGPANVHPGQGTANRRFFFHNAMLELLWVDDAVEAQNTRTRPTHLWERWHGRHGDASPFGICLRPRHAETATLPFPAWAYEPTYLPAPRVIHMGENSAVIAEPLLFYLAFGQRPDTGGARYPMTHAIELREITALRIQGPQQAPLSPALQAMVQSGMMTWSAGAQHHLEIGFDGETRGKVIDFRPVLPLSLCW